MFAISVILSGILIPQILLIAFRKKLFDTLSERKIHKTRIPRLGGMVFTPVICLTLGIVLGVNCALGQWQFFATVVNNVNCLLWGLCGLFSIYLVGMVDDISGVRYRSKFIVQIICGIMLLFGGLGITDFEGLLWIHNVSPVIGYPLSVFFLVFVINAINLIDGIDGLASGLSAMVFILYGIFYLFAQCYFFAAICLAALGVLIPFFYYNVFGKAEKRTKIFMGDTGSLTIGFLIVFLGMHILTLPGSTVETLPEIFRNRMIVVLAPLFLPCFDVVRVFIHRVRNHRNPFLPDKNHIHHKLLDMGFKQHNAMITIISISLVSCIVNIVAARYININLLIFLDIIAWSCWNIHLTKGIRKNQTETIKN